MSLYTPVFPDMDPPPSQPLATQSSSSSINTSQAPRVSYSAYLSQWHLGIATLPEVLCPPSPPLSVHLKERSEILQTEIERAVREGRTLPDHCKLLCSRLTCTSIPHAQRSVDTEDHMVIGPLVDTEEEWLEWEAQLAEKRARPTGMVQTGASLSSQTQDAHDKVVSWKSTLQEAKAPPSESPAMLMPSSQSTLGFPVVKRASTLKEIKCKPSTQASSVQNSQIQVRDPDNKCRSPRPVPSVAADTRNNAVHVDTSDTQHSNSERQQQSATENVAEEDHSEQHEKRTSEPVNPDESVAPLSFPPNLPTSTLKVEVDHIFDISYPPPSFPSDLVTSTQKAAHEESGRSKAIDSSARQEATEVLESVKSPATEKVMRLTIPHATPPSPPYSSPTSQDAHSAMQIVEMRQVVEVKDLPKELLSPKAVTLIRPITPPSDDCVRSSPGPETRPSTLPSVEKSVPEVSIANDCNSTSRRTPQVEADQDEFMRPQEEHSPTKQDSKVLSNAVGGTVTEPSNANVLPNLEDVPEPDSVAPLGTAYTSISPPRTPDRPTSVLPTTSDLLATSRRSATRPRPPSRRASRASSVMDVDGEGVDPSPAKSDRSYFSSPASSSSGGSDASIAFSYVASGPPESPTGFGFTQDPGKFAPAKESTVIYKEGEEPLFDSSPRARLRALSASQSQSQLQSQLDGNTPSKRSDKSKGRQKGGFGMMAFSSQFDVDEQVGELSTFLAKDVDLDYWGGELDGGLNPRLEYDAKGLGSAGALAEEMDTGVTDEEDANAVEDLTSVLSPLSGQM